MMSPLLIATLMATFAAVLLLSGAAAYAVVQRQAPERKRLHQAVAIGRATAVSGPMALTDRPHPVIERIASFVPKSPDEMNRLRRRLVRAGYHSMAAAVVFSVAEIVAPLVVAVAVLIMQGGTRGILFGLLAGVVGYLLPGVVLGRLIERRRHAISDGLPDVLDLLIVCLEAGCSLDQSIVRATEELHLAYPPLGDELKMLTTETRAGKPRLEAFKNLEARTKNDDVKSLVAMLIQTDRFGTSVSQALRTFAEVARTKRRQRAEEKAAKMGVKMVFPLVLCLFPALYVVTLGPAAIMIMHVLFGQLAN
jgi:tight adherence protein C